VGWWRRRGGSDFSAAVVDGEYQSRRRHVLTPKMDQEKKPDAGGQKPSYVPIYAAIFFIVAGMVLYSLNQRKLDARPPGENWKEEVRLMNGELLVVDRQHIYGDEYRPNFYGGHVTDATIAYEYRGKSYRWQHKDVYPMSLQVEPSGRHVIVTGIMSCGNWQDLGKPESHYVAFANDGDGWREVSIDDVDPATVFNLAEFSRDRDGKNPQKLVKESAWRFKDSHNAYNAGIVPNLKEFCRPKGSE
jgi:hypothetical protein